MAGLSLWSATRGDFRLSGDAKQQLAAFKLHAAARSARLAATAASALRILEAKGVDAALFKGIATEARWYPERGTRPAADVDLFIDPASHGRLNEIIALFQPDHALAGAAQRLFDKGRLQGFDVAHNGIWIDFHTDPIKVGVPLPRLEEVWDRTEVMDLGGVEARVIDLETSILQAVVHLQKDRFSELHGYVDVARMARQEVDWRWLQQYAEEAGLVVHLNEGLNAINEALDLDLPFNPEQTSTLWQRLWPADTRLRGKVGKTRKVRTHYWIPFTMRGRRWEAFRWWSGVVLPAPEMIDYLHPEVKGPYLWRLLTYRTSLAWSRHKRNTEQRRAGSLSR